MSELKMPVLFIGHGSPMNAIEENEFSQSWEAISQTMPQPKAILCISAHWETASTQVTAMAHPKTIHDFYGFPRELNEMQYPAPGSPELAEKVCQLLAAEHVTADQSWGLDHGAWSVLARMYPQAEVPVVQLSLAQTRDGQLHYELGKKLAPLREEGVLILGSGNIVHNLRLMSFEGEPYLWAVEFDQQAKAWIESKNHSRLIHFQELGRSAALAINSAEHFLPLMYILALQQIGEEAAFYCEAMSLGSFSMRCVRFG